LTAKKAAGGYIPNFSPFDGNAALGEAIKREKQAGVARADIRVGASPRFQTIGNPAGLAVTNILDEPRGIKDVPNFADPGVTNTNILGSALSAGRLAEFERYLKSLGGSPLALEKMNAALTGAADSWANNRIRTGELSTEVRKITGTIGLSEEEQRKVLKSSKAYARSIRPGGGMGGMVAMMAAPMIGGMAEQAVGGREGAAIGGGLTGGMTGGIMGGMGVTAMAGALAGTGITPVVGTAIGAVVGASMGIASSLSATAESAASASTALQELAGATQANTKGALAYVQAIQELNMARTEDELKIASVKASAALDSIGDSTLRGDLDEAGDNVKTLMKNLETWSTLQASLGKIAASNAGIKIFK
jgi:hypothetical protein